VQKTQPQPTPQRKWPEPPAPIHGGAAEHGVFNPTEIVIDGFLEKLRSDYRRMFGAGTAYTEVAEWVARMALEKIANCNALYHDVEHTINVTLCAQQVLRGRSSAEGDVTPDTWLNFTVSALCFAIGYVRGCCPGDSRGQFVADASGRLVTLPPGATDAALTPFATERSKLFVLDRFRDHPLIDAAAVAANIDYCRFPVDPAQHDNGGWPGLLRAAHLIGACGAPNLMIRMTALVLEYKEAGLLTQLNCNNAADFRRLYPDTIYRGMILPVIGPALRYLRETQEGQQWVANMHAHLLAEKHDLPALGVARG